jgi:Zn-dependent M28 family amino/carboxypeptidase
MNYIKHISISGLFSMLFVLPIFSQSASVAVSEKMAYSVSKDSVSTRLEYLTSDLLEGRDTGTKGGALAAAHLENYFKSLSILPYFESYRDTLSNFEKPAYNVVGFLEGTDPKLKHEFIIFSAHYDHIGIIDKKVKNDSIANGANDNATGCLAVAEIARYFSSQKNNKRSILFVFFSGEEKGLLGSRHLAAKLKSENFNLYSMLNFEMIGVPMKRDFLTYITGYNKSNMAEKMNEYAGKKTVGFLQAELHYRLFMASDNFPFFLEFNVPAQTVSTFDFENYQYYHHVSDDFSQMNTEFMTEYIQEMLPIVTKMVNASEKEIVLKK